MAQSTSASTDPTPANPNGPLLQLVELARELGGEGAWIFRGLDAARLEYIDAAGPNITEFPGAARLLVIRFPDDDGGLPCPALLDPAPGACRRCLCTEDMPCPNGCYWVETDLCSNCVDDEAEEQVPA